MHVAPLSSLDADMYRLALAARARRVASGVGFLTVGAVGTEANRGVVLTGTCAAYP